MTNAIDNEISKALGWKRRHKYGVADKERRTYVSGSTVIVFDSRDEMIRYSELDLEQRAGVISELELQVPYAIVMNGHLCGTYFADFRYKGVDGRIFIEDVKSKGTRTREYRLKKKLVEAQYGIRIVEVEIDHKGR